MKSKEKSNTKIIIGVFVIISIIIIAVMILFSGSNSSSQESIDQFAKCITENNGVMYGAFWCPHCARTKKRFGSSFKYIKYIECDPRGENEQSELCLQKEIDSYDTWEFEDGSRLIGEPSFEALSQKTGCPLPN